jgi:hypothetical protein
MGGVLQDIGSAYQQAIVDSGKQPELLLYVAFLATFAFIRTSTHMIRAGVSWWPGNVSTKGGTHVHHMVFGILALLVVGFCSLSLDPDTPWRDVLAVLFGIGAGLTLDEFALWLNLEDVYWAPKGRQSIDAVIVASVLGGLGLLGVRVWVDLGDEVEAVVAAAGFFGAMVAALNVAKGKLVVAMASLLVPVVGAVGIARLARPESPWARLYDERKRKRSRERFPEPWLPARVLASRKGRAGEPGPPVPDAAPAVGATTREADTATGVRERG